MCTVNGTQSTWQCPVSLFSSASPVRKLTRWPLAASSCSRAFSKVWGLPMIRPSSVGDLIGADDQVSWMVGGEGAGFLFGQALDQFDG
jgi:hypothetical protein